MRIKKSRKVYITKDSMSIDIYKLTAVAMPVKLSRRDVRKSFVKGGNDR
jgi:hypothetical protein